MEEKRKQRGRPRASERRIQTSITIELSVFNGLFDYAEANNVTLSSLISETMKQFLADKNKE